MSVDKLVDSTQLNSDLTSVANAIRTKGGTSAQLAFPSDFVSAIGAIPTGGSGSFELLNTITIAEAVNAIKIDIDPAWNVYDMIYIEADTIFSGGDFLYYDFDTMTPTHYIGTGAQHWFIAVMTKNNGTWTKTLQTYNGHTSSTGFPEYLYMKAYTESKNFTTATTITIHGGKLS